MRECVYVGRLESEVTWWTRLLSISDTDRHMHKHSTQTHQAEGKVKGWKLKRDWGWLRGLIDGGAGPKDVRLMVLGQDCTCWIEHDGCVEQEEAIALGAARGQRRVTGNPINCAGKKIHAVLLCQTGEAALNHGCVRALGFLLMLFLFLPLTRVVTNVKGL